MESVESKIPPALLDRLIPLRPLLERNGVLQLLGNKIRLRYRAECDGYRVHRSLLIGDDPEVVDAVETLLARWRAERQARFAEEEKRETEARLAARKERLLRQLFCSLDGGGWRRQRQLRDFYNECQADPRNALRYVVTHELPPRRKSGRPRKFIWGAPRHTSDGGLPNFSQEVMRPSEAV